MMPITAAAGLLPASLSGSLFGTPVDWASPASASATGTSATAISGTGTSLTINGSGFSIAAPGMAVTPTMDMPAGTAVSGLSSSAPFADIFTEAVGQVDSLEKQARSAVEGLISGRGVDVHEAMIASEKAEMGFELVLSVRNKALAAYQQVVGMQF